MSHKKRFKGLFLIQPIHNPIGALDCGDRRDLVVGGFGHGSAFGRPVAREFPPYVLKLDTEGAEHLVLAGRADVLADENLGTALAPGRLRRHGAETRRQQHETENGRHCGQGLADPASSSMLTIHLNHSLSER